MNLISIGKNQNELKLDENTTVFFSYNSPVAARIMGSYYLTEKIHSTTTTRHINNWLNAYNVPGYDQFNITVEVKPQSFFDNLTGGKA